MRGRHRATPPPPIVDPRRPSGKRPETVELDLDVGDPLHVSEMNSAERALLVARVLEHHPLAELVPMGLRAVAAVEKAYPQPTRVEARDSQAHLRAGRRRGYPWRPAS